MKPRSPLRNSAVASRARRYSELEANTYSVNMLGDMSSSSPNRGRYAIRYSDSCSSTAGNRRLRSDPFQENVETILTTTGRKVFNLGSPGGGAPIFDDPPSDAHRLGREICRPTLSFRTTITAVEMLRIFLIRLKGNRAIPESESHG